MINPRDEAVLVLNLQKGQFDDRTKEISRYAVDTERGTVSITFRAGREYPYRQARIRILRDPDRVVLDAGNRVEVDGRIWDNATEVVTFFAPEGAWCRIFYRKQTGVEYSTRPAATVRVVSCATVIPEAGEVMRYWRAVAAGLPDGDQLNRTYRRQRFIAPESALGRYLTGAPIEHRELTAAPIFPFRCNLSQREAVANGLTRSISVIEGPPGTGKTETILNLIANIVVQRKTVGVVSYGNAAVDNVRVKLDELGFGHVLARLGRAEKRVEFLAGQEDRNVQVDMFATDVPLPPAPADLADVDERLRRLQDAERTRAIRRQQAAAYRLELEHFERHLRHEEVPDLEGLPLLRRSANRILDYLAETELGREAGRPGLIRRIRRYFRYGSLRGLDPGDTAVVLRLQQAYYDRRIAELDEEIDRLEGELRQADFDQLAREHQRLSVQLLHADLGARYKAVGRRIYDEKTYRHKDMFRDFVADYPVLLSTCHSLQSSIPDGHLLDYVIIDEASQVNQLAAGLVLSSCRNLVVVGDQRQIWPITLNTETDLRPPKAAFQCDNNLIASLTELYGDDLPRTLLREHYRCDPVIIGYCNKKFYDHQLIPYTTNGADRPMRVVRTVEGNHMRQHSEGGRSNQREVDVIVREVIPEYCAGVAGSDIGITAPYRRQADKAADVLDQAIEADTIHRFQGRQKKVVILTTVLDETWRGRTGLPFVDDPRMINVAVSRAIRQFILVTNHDMLSTSRHIRDLVGYIRYQDPEHGVADSSVTSMFDLLYSSYSERLRSLAARLRNEMEYRSEDIAWTVLHDILDKPPYTHLAASAQIMLRNLLPDLSRLTARQLAFTRRRSSIDFVVYNRVTNHPLLAIEVDGFAYHENNPRQRERDAIKDDILRAYEMPLLRLPTTGSGEDERIRQALDDAEAHWARVAS